MLRMAENVNTLLSDKMRGYILLNEFQKIKIHVIIIKRIMLLRM